MISLRLIYTFIHMTNSIRLCIIQKSKYQGEK